MKSHISHNKKRNSALLYEFLIRHVAKSLIHNKQDEAKRALNLSKKYFAKGKPLNEELKLFRNIMETDVASRHSAQKILTSVCESAKRTNSRDLDKEKSKLIKEINHTLEYEGVYDYKIPGYTIYASIQSLLSESRSKKKNLTDVQRIKLEDVVTEHLIKEKISPPVKLEVNPDYSNTVYGFVVQRFNKKYSDKLSESQRTLLNNYAAYSISNDEKKMVSILKESAADIKRRLLAIKDSDVRDDKPLMKKITECYNSFALISFDEVTDNTILEVLRYTQLVEEVES